MTCHLAHGFELAQGRHLDAATLFAFRTTAIKAAHIGVGVDWALRLARKPGLSFRLSKPRHGRNQRVGVRMQRPLERLSRWARFDDLAEIHDEVPFSWNADHREIVGDEE